jgi:hypothetical protein
MRPINWDAPLSDDDKAWLRMAGVVGTEDRIAENEALYGAAEDVSDNPEDDYDERTVAELKAEASSREPAVSVSGKRADIIAALRAWDVEHPEAE